MKILFIRKGDVTGVPRKKLKSAHFELPEFSSETTLEKSALRFLLSLCQVGQRGANILGGPGRHLFEIGEVSHLSKTCFPKSFDSSVVSFKSWRHGKTRKQWK